jgi:superkiller protein 3
LEDYEVAVENSSTALDLSEELKGLKKMRLSSQITVGLGYYFLGQMQDAIDMFQTVLAESDEDIDVMLLIARALWAVGGDQEREIAIQQIHEWYNSSEISNTSLVKDPHHIDALCSLGAIGILRNDKNAMHHAEKTLRNTKGTPQTNKQVRHLLMEISRKQGQNIDDISRAGIMLNPSSAREWINLSLNGDATSQLALKLTSQDHTMDTEEYSMIYEKSGSLGDVQSGILFSPWRLQGWQKLKNM